MSIEEDTSSIFLHIPKTAGTTLHHIIERQYPPEAIVSFGPDAHQSIREFRALSSEKRAQIRMLKGHMGFGLHTYLPNPAVYFTLVRDPIARVISHYYHVLRDPNHYLFPHTQGGQLGLAAFLETGMPLMLDNGQTRLISGVWDELPFGACDEAVLQIAKRNLDEHFVLVGLTECFDEALCILRSILGWSSDISYVRENVARNRPSEHDLSWETLNAARQVNLLDMALYDYSERLFQERVKQFGSSLTVGLGVLKARNRLRVLSYRFNAVMCHSEGAAYSSAVRRLISSIRHRLTSHYH